MPIPFEKYLNIRAAYSPSFSPDGKRIAFLTNITGVPQVWAVNARGGWADQLTFDSERVSRVFYSPTENRIVYARDIGGNENAQIFLINADGSNERRLTHDDGAMHTLGGWSPDGTRISFAANRRKRGLFDVYVQEINSDDAVMVWENNSPAMVSPAGFSSDGTRLLISLAHGGMNQDLYEVNIAARTARCLTPHQDTVRYGSPVYSADGKSVYCASDLDRDFAGVARIDLADLALRFIAQPDAEVEDIAPSRDEKYLAWVTNRDGANALTLYDLKTQQSRTATLPRGVINPQQLDAVPLVFSPDSHAIAFSFTTPSRTIDVWIWDLQTNDLRAITQSSHAGISTESFVEPELVHYPTFDRRSIPAWFSRPKNPRGKFPVLVQVHGGPEGQTQPMFFPIFQYFLQRGYAVLSPNVRGSSGYGKTYSHLDDVEKRMDSVADLAHAVYWLREQPDVDTKRIAVYGQSYGGFMVLAALTNYPDLWAAGVDIVGIGNFVTFLEHTSAYRRSHREKEYGSLERDREFLTRISPLNQVEKIRAPLIVIHGANDPRVPLIETEQIVKALRARNVPVELLVYPDEGHGLVKLANKLDAYPKIADFLDRHVMNAH